MDAEKSSMIDKIMKLLELGKDDNGAHDGEREAANNMAAKLMAKHSIDFADLRTGKKTFDFTKQRVKAMDDFYCQWEGHLAYGLATAFDCKVVHWGMKGNWEIEFFGTKSDIEISIFFYSHLRRTIGRKAELAYRSKKDVETYATGMVLTINARLLDLYKRRQEVMESDSRALVIVKTDGVNDYMKAEVPALRTIKSRKVDASSDAFRNGRADGHNVNISRPIANSNGASMRTIRGH